MAISTKKKKLDSAKLKDFEDFYIESIEKFNSNNDELLGELAFSLWEDNLQDILNQLTEYNNNTFPPHGGNLFNSETRRLLLDINNMRNIIAHKNKINELNFFPNNVNKSSGKATSKNGKLSVTEIRNHTHDIIDATIKRYNSKTETAEELYNRGAYHQSFDVRYDKTDFIQRMDKFIMELKNIPLGDEDKSNAKNSVSVEKNKEIPRTGKPYCVGIDLGTTNSSIGYVVNQMPELVSSTNGRTNLVPSAIYIKNNEIDSSLFSYGESALNDSPKYGDTRGHLFAEFKRQMGTNTKENNYSATKLSKFLLSHLKRLADAKLDGEGYAENAVITVPAKFGTLSRLATIKAAKDAGFKEVRLLSEPTAAAIAYFKGKKISGTILVYDLGGGTFDVTLLKTVDGEKFEVISTDGNTHLGGKDFDNIIAEIVQEKLASEGYQQEITTRLLSECKKAREELSLKEKEEIRGDSPESPFVEISKEEFENHPKTKKFVAETIAKMYVVLDYNNMTMENIDYLVPTGGSCRMPIIKSALREEFGDDKIFQANLDELVALGGTIASDWFSKGIFDEKVEEKTSLGLGMIYLKSGKENLPGGSSGEYAKSHPEECENTYTNRVIVPPNADLKRTYKSQIASVPDGEERECFWIDITEGDSNSAYLAKHPFEPKCYDLDQVRTGNENIHRVELSYDKDLLLVVKVFEVDAKDETKEIEREPFHLERLGGSNFV